MAIREATSITRNALSIGSCLVVAVFVCIKRGHYLKNRSKAEIKNFLIKRINWFYYFE